MHPVPASQMRRWPVVFMWSVRACVHPSVRPRPSSCELRVFLGQLWSFLLSECVCCVCAVWFSWCNSSALPSCSCAICGFCGDDSSHSSLGDCCCLLLSYHPGWRFVSFVNLSGSLHSRNCASLKFFEQPSLDMEHLSKLTMRPFLLHLDELGRNSCEHTRPLPNPPLGASGSHLTFPVVLERSKSSLGPGNVVQLGECSLILYKAPSLIPRYAGMNLSLRHCRRSGIPNHILGYMATGKGGCHVFYEGSFNTVSN